MQIEGELLVCGQIIWRNFTSDCCCMHYHSSAASGWESSLQFCISKTGSDTTDEHEKVFGDEINQTK